MKKRAIIVVALAIVLALSIATIATAKYAGAFRGEETYANGKSTSGYLSWSGANAVWNRDAGTTGQQITAHGGYQRSSVKCAVCHSAHRAVGPTAGEDWHLTSGAGVCVNCHTAWGAGGATKLIEWANLNEGKAGGPHNGFNCVSNCHTNGIHGYTQSKFHGNNAYLLGGAKVDADIDAAFAAGNVSTNINSTGATPAGAGWFVAGTTGVPADGSRPTSNDRQFAAAKAMATGYTCNQSGCHTNSQFAVNKWGYSEKRIDAASSLDTTITGHATGAWGHDGGSPSCAPCHPGGLAGGYRFDDAITWFAPGENRKTSTANGFATSYGCDQCHDMVGKATNTTAWPHGNRNIDVYQWDVAGSKTTTTTTNGNIWMYDYSIGTTLPDDPSALTDSGKWAQAQGDKSFNVVSGAVEGNPHNVGSIRDGVCLKCHVPVDAASQAAAGGYLNVAGRQHTYQMGTSGANAGKTIKAGVATNISADTGMLNSTNPAYYTGSKLIWLWK